MKNIAKFLIICFVVVASALPVFGGKDIELKNPDEVYIHSVTKFQFPPKAGDFKRARVHQYDDAGLDVSGAYHHASGIIATVYVYPVAPVPDGDLLKIHFENCKQAIVQHPDTTLISEGNVEISPGGKKHQGLRVAYKIISKDFRSFEKGEVLISELYLFPLGANQMLKFRITYPKAQEPIAGPAIKALLNSLVWP